MSSLLWACASVCAGARAGAGASPVQYSFRCSSAIVNVSTVFFSSSLHIGFFLEFQVTSLGFCMIRVGFFLFFF